MLAAIRKKLGVGPADKVAFNVDGDVITIRPVRTTLEIMFGAVPSLSGVTLDFELEIEEAMQDEADRITLRASGE